MTINYCDSIDSWTTFDSEDSHDSWGPEDYKDDGGPSVDSDGPEAWIAPWGDRAEPWRPIHQRHLYRKIDAETIVRQQQPHLDEPDSAHRLRCAYKKLFKEDKKFFMQQ